MEQSDHELILEIMESPIRWAETFLIEPTTGELFKANYVERTILSAKGPWVVIRVPRRQGKTYSLAVLTLWSVVVNPNYQVLIFAPQNDQVNDFFAYIRSFLAVNPAINDAVVISNRSPQLIEFSNGSTIRGRTTGASSNRKAMTARGKGADLLILDEAAYLREEDYQAIMPIVSNDIYRKEVKIYAASTPTADHGRYYTWATSKDTGWDAIHIPITEIPEITPEQLAMIKSLHSDYEWVVEDLAEFPDIGDSVFRNTDIDAAKTEYTYSLDKFTPGSIRVMGVDWDKHSAGVNIVIIEMVPGVAKVRIVYREEISRGEYTLTNAVNRIIGLNQLVNPNYIYVDRGYGENQIETLKLYGTKYPETGLKTKVVGIMFGQNVPVYDPVTGLPVNKQFKAVMINNMTRMFEDHHLEFSDKDKILEKQLRGYKILGLSSDRIQTTRKNEHIIDALGLALYGLFVHYQNDLRFKPAKQVVVKQAPVPIKSRLGKIRDARACYNLGAPITNRAFTRGFVRGNLMGSSPKRANL